MKMPLLKKLVRLLLFTLLALHFLVVAVCLIPENPVYGRYHNILRPYFSPFSQSWSMFSPPPDYNLKLYYRFIYRHEGDIDTTIYYDVLTPLNEYHWKEASAIPRVAYYLYNSATQIVEADKYFKKKIYENDTLSKDSINALKYYFHNMNNVSSHKALVEYAKSTFLRLGLHENIPGVDRVAVKYKIIMYKFPDFDHRHLDYYDRKNQVKDITESGYTDISEIASPFQTSGS